MSTVCSRTTTFTYTGDLTLTQTVEALQNPASPGVVELMNLAVGNNLITVPTGGATAVAATIVPPPGNTNAITLKALPGDTGIRLHDTDPTTIAFDPSVTSFYLVVATATNGVRLFWS